MARLSIHLLGPFYVTLDGEPVVSFESNKVRALLACLAVEADRPHMREALAGLLWPNQPERSACHALSQALCNLRQVLHDDTADPPFLEITRGTVQFNPTSDYWLDVAVFNAHLAACPHGSPLHARYPEPCIERLEEAAELYQGEFLNGFFVDNSVPFAEWATLLRERLHRRAIEMLTRLAAYYERIPDYKRACDCVRRQIEMEPWCEEAHQQLMWLLAHTGQRSAALHQYELCCHILAEELNVAPSGSTQRLHARIASATEIGAHNLPPSLTPLVGREAELHEIARHLADPGCHLLSIVGPGGVGKTRLAIQAAYETRFSYLHGVCFVPLAAVHSSSFLVAALANGLHLQLQSEEEPGTQVTEVLRSRETLVVLDPFEHLIEEGAAFLSGLLRTAPEVKLLVTSRQRLNLYGETVMAVGATTPQPPQRIHPV